MLCLITGCAGGIGQAAVTAFSDAGYEVIGIDSRPRPKGLNVTTYLRSDLALVAKDRAHADSLRSVIYEHCGGRGINVLVNNAAVQIQGGVSTLELADWDTTLNVNLLAPFFLTQLLLPQLELAKGVVINVSSIHATQTKPGFVAYATSKAALSGLTRAMAIDLGSKVRVNAIEPAAIETPMLKSGFSDFEGEFRKLQACHPCQDIGKAEDLARLILAIARPEMAFLHGASIPFDGGIAARLLDPA